MYSALDIARYIIAHENSEGRSVSNLRLQKLLYFIQVRFIVTYGVNHPCFYDDIEAWSFGPVVPTVYQAYKVFGGGTIPLGIGDTPQYKLREGDKLLIDGMLDDCANYSTSHLVDITHGQSPWIDAHRNYLDNRITNEAIARYFS